jgi:hypothetical protein
MEKELRKRLRDSDLAMNEIDHILNRVVACPRSNLQHPTSNEDSFEADYRYALYPIEAHPMLHLTQKESLPRLCAFAAHSARGKPLCHFTFPLQLP